MRQRIAAAAALGGALLALVTSRADLQAAQDSPLVVELSEYAFAPTVLAAQAGTVSLNLVNTGIRRHNMVVLVDGLELESPYLRPGEATTWEVPLDQPGVYRFWCAEYRHLEKGMAGEIAVN
jgi:plastocyanin